MKTKDFAKSVDSLPKSQKMAILEVIDTKVENDMKEVLYELKGTKEAINAELKSMNSRITTLYWLIGALGLLISILKIMA